MSRVVSVIVLSALAMSMLGGCQKQAKADDKADAQAILNVEGAMRAAYAAKDPAKLASTYASDATLYVPGELRPRVGTDAIAKAAAKDFTDPAFHVNFTTGQVNVAGDKGWTKGSFTIRFTDPKTKAAAGYSGYYLTLFSRQKDGSWKAIEDMATPAS